MSVICCNYRDINYVYGNVLLNGIPNNNNVDTHCDAAVLEELINIRDGYMSCEHLSLDEVSEMILSICIS